jgi:hypothetical protein
VIGVRSIDDVGGVHQVCRLFRPLVDWDPANVEPAKVVCRKLDLVENVPQWLILPGGLQLVKDGAEIP